MDFSLFPTEALNPKTKLIDQVSTVEMLTLINQEDQTVAAAVAKAIPQIASAVDTIATTFQAGGRLYYFGAGTSGRLGVLDASECPPTFGAPPEQVQGFIAGGDNALRHPIEGAEDSESLGREDFLNAYQPGVPTVVVGLSASGGAAYVQGVLQAAKEKGCPTIAITCNPNAVITGLADIAIVTEVGPEVLAGSTRLKAGTAQKLVLNMLTTGSMIKIGKTYENWMVDVQPTNRKLRDRAIRIVCGLSGASREATIEALAACQQRVKVAVLMLAGNMSPLEAESELAKYSGKLRIALASVSDSLTVIQ